MIAPGPGLPHPLSNVTLKRKRAKRRINTYHSVGSSVSTILTPLHLLCSALKVCGGDGCSVPFHHPQRCSWNLWRKTKLLESNEDVLRSIHLHADLTYLLKTVCNPLPPQRTHMSLTTLTNDGVSSQMTTLHSFYCSPPAQSHVSAVCPQQGEEGGGLEVGGGGGWRVEGGGGKDLETEQRLLVSLDFGLEKEQKCVCWCGYTGSGAESFFEASQPCNHQQASVMKGPSEWCTFSHLDRDRDPFGGIPFAVALLHQAKTPSHSVIIEARQLDCFVGGPTVDSLK
ncbi:hypothetical protein TcWFU_004256 [Taenia crassiceps]|uniref:Uncharacterized protein n=1 Tax=Taenia crassiceps TaxID=6207 RepID=A0ABR4Q983_9CEST